MEGCNQQLLRRNCIALVQRAREWELHKDDSLLGFVLCHIPVLTVGQILIFFSLSAKQQKYIHEVRNKIYEVGKISESEKLVNQLSLLIGVDQINGHFR